MAISCDFTAKYSKGNIKKLRDYRKIFDNFFRKKILQLFETMHFLSYIFHYIFFNLTDNVAKYSQVTKEENIMHVYNTRL
jgi:hypothetical protein